MEYDIYVKEFVAQEQLDPSWLSLRVASHLPILVEGITWMRIQIGVGRGSGDLCPS